MSHDHRSVRAHLATIEAQSVATDLAHTHLVQYQSSAGRRTFGFWFTERVGHFIIYSTPYRCVLYNLVFDDKHLGYMLRFLTLTGQKLSREGEGQGRWQICSGPPRKNP